MCDTQGKLNSSVEELTQPFIKLESIVQQPDLKVDSVNGLISEERTSISSEDQNIKKEANCEKDHSTGELDAGQESGVTLEVKGSASGQDKDAVNSLDTTAHKEEWDKRQAETTHADDRKRDEHSVEHVAEHQAEETMISDIDNEKANEAAEVISSTKHTSSGASRDAECNAGADIEGRCGEEYRICTEKQATEERNKVNAESDVQDVKLPSKPDEVNDVNQVAAQLHHAASQGMPAPSPQLPHFHREANLPSKPEAYHEMSQIPAQPHHAPTQGPPPQPQHFVMQQQFMGLQQQLLQMEQQRQVLVQQYQQLQQQLHQAGGQDAGLASQVMAVQSQGQTLQQQMVQVHQQMQLLQQQFAMQQQQSQVQQWPQQGHPIGVQPGSFPVRPGMVGMQHPLQAALPLPDKVRYFS